jgi:predicted membrane chloride channel (bestrophin family)
MYQKVNQLYVDKKITGDQLINLDKELKDFIDLLGACERIKNTPIPLFIHDVRKEIYFHLHHYASDRICDNVWLHDYSDRRTDILCTS